MSRERADAYVVLDITLGTDLRSAFSKTFILSCGRNVDLSQATAEVSAEYSRVG